MFCFISFVASAHSRKDKSLRIMSQKFVMLFLVSKTKIVTLDMAAKILIEESQDTPDHMLASLPTHVGDPGAVVDLA